MFWCSLRSRISNCNARRDGRNGKKPFRFPITNFLIVLLIFALLLVSFSPSPLVLAATTGTLRPTADGGDDSAYWKNQNNATCSEANCSLSVDNDPAVSCGSSGSEHIKSNSSQTAPQTFDVDESSIPNNSTVTKIAITVCNRKDTGNPTFQTRQCHNGSCTNSGADISAGGSYAEATQNISVNYTKTSSSDIEIGVASTSTGIAKISQISAVITYTPPDTTPPVITNIQASNITKSTAKITWTTNEPATSQVEYGKTTSYGKSTTLDSTLVTSHSVNLSGLAASTTYHYRVKSKDANNNLKTSSDKTFTTSAGPDTTPPAISGIKAKNVSQTGATIIWTTDEKATSQVQYGKTKSYGNSTTLDSTLVTSHSVKLAELTADTTYHYRVKSKDANNNLKTSSDKTFTTAGEPLSGEEAEQQLPGTPTVEAPKIEADKTPPKVSLKRPSPNPTKSATTTFKGSATEKKGIISALQYSLNGGTSWHPIKNIKGLGKKKASFLFTTPFLEDGNYGVVARAVDNSDNVGLSKIRVLVVDALPPLVGGHIATLGPQVLIPNEKGFVTAVVGSEQRIVLSAVGGPTKVEIVLAPTASDQSAGGEETFLLEYSSDTRLWSGNVRFGGTGAWDLKVAAQDGANNKTERFLGSVLVQPGGEVLDAQTGDPIEKAEVYLYYFEEVTKDWVLWDAASFGLKNPYLTDRKGQYSFFVPPGRYYLSVKAPGYRTLTSEIVELERGSLLGYVFRLPPRPYITIPFFGITIHLPSFLDLAVVGKEDPGIDPSELDLESRTLEVGSKIPQFALTDLKGKEVSSKDLKGKLFLTFGSVWSPVFSEQAPILNTLAKKKKVFFYVIFLQEKASEVETFLKRGGYSFPSLVDKTGALAKSHKVFALPQHYFIDGGVVRAVEMGVLEETKFLEFFQ